jgi:hypothetical protein
LKKVLSQAFSLKEQEDYEPSIEEALPIYRHMVMSDLENVQVTLPITVTSINHYDPIAPESYKLKDSSCSIQ